MIAALALQGVYQQVAPESSALFFFFFGFNKHEPVAGSKNVREHDQINTKLFQDRKIEHVSQHKT